MAIGLDDVSKSTKKGVKSLLDIILDRQEAKIRAESEGKKVKRRVLRPWESFNDDKKVKNYDVKPKSSIMRSFDLDPSLSEEERMALKIRRRADQLFINISDFL